MISSDLPVLFRPHVQALGGQLSYSDRHMVLPVEMSGRLGMAVVLRTMTLHLPTNLPPPVHAEVIRMSPAYDMSWNGSRVPNFLCLAQLTVGPCWMPNKCGGVAIAHVQLHRFNKRPASRIRHSVGSNQEYQSLLGSALTLRLLALIARSLITDQSETKPTARQWL